MSENPTQPVPDQSTEEEEGSRKYVPPFQSEPVAAPKESEPKPEPDQDE